MTAITALGHTDLYVVVATALPTLVVALLLQTRLGDLAKATRPLLALVAVIVFAMVSGEVVAVLALATGRDTAGSRALALTGLGVAGFMLVSPLIMGRLLPRAGSEAWWRFLIALAVAAAFFAGAIYLALRLLDA